MVQSWQERLDSLTSKAHVVGLTKTLKTLRNKAEEDIVKVIVDLDLYRNDLLDWMNQTLTTSNSTHCKAASRASTYRSLGNDRFRAFDNAGSLALYTESVRFAPEASAELPLALANRSAVLFHMNHYKECLRDINVALLKDYPQHLQFKLLTRQGNCLVKLEKFTEAVDALALARKALEHVENESKSKMALLHNEIDASMANAMQQLNLQTFPNIATASKLVSPTQGENLKFMYASATLDLKFSKEKGRHVVANRNIETGDILFVEKPYAFVVLPDSYGQHCHHCCSTFTAPIPCWQCTEALYCGNECRHDSWSQYHQYECQGLPLFHSIGIAHLGLRVVLKGGTLEKLKHNCESLRLNPTSSSDIYGCKEDNYPAVYQLMAHVNDMENDDLLQYALTAALLLLYLKHKTDYFNKTEAAERFSDANVNTDDNVFIGGLLLRHIAQLVCNGHAITKLDKLDSVSNVVTETQVRVATAIYPSASMMNHSCDPNIVNSFNDEHLIVRATKPIPKGKEVFNCYGPHFKRMGLKERQDILSKQYFFPCKCGPCSLPIDHDFQDRFNALLCLSCGGPVVRSNALVERETLKMVCMDCGRGQDTSQFVEATFKAYELFNEGVRELEIGDILAALSNFQSCLVLRRECLYKYNHELTACVDQIARCYSTLGDYEKSMYSLLQSLPAVTEQFGEQSIELANELQKLSDVMLADLQQEQPGTPIFKTKHKELKKHVDKAHQIMDLHYGEWNLGLQEILAKKTHLEEIEKQMTQSAQ